VNQSETEAKILAALQDETTQSFVETPLEDAIQVISKFHDIPIIVDRRALEEVGLTPDTPVNLDLKNVSLRSFLRLMLRELDLTYLIQDEVMQITTTEAAEQNLITRVYRLPDSLVKDASRVLEVTQGAVVPDTWSTVGGPSTAASIDHVLVISSTSDVHQQAEAFLNTLIEAYEK
jgi:type II secretory pathway component GspD/PulD (secretin)